MSRTTSSFAPSRSIWLECMGAEVPKLLFTPESAKSKSLQKLFATIRGKIGFRVCTCDICNRCAYACVYRGCQKSVDLARIRSAEDRCHARDLSARVDLVSHGCEEVGTCRKQRIKVGHHAVLPDEGMRPVEVSVQGASHHLAPVVDASGYGGKISRQSAKVCECAVLPKRAIDGCVVSATDDPNNLALIVNAVGATASSEIRKRGESVACPQYGVIRRCAGSRVAYGLALIVDRECEPV